MGNTTLHIIENCIQSTVVKVNVFQKPRDKELTEEQKKKRAEKRAKRNEKLRLKREQKEKENENPEKK